jgi:hypothetical protein
MPICGLARKIQETVNRIDGITSGISESAKKMDLKGVFVRSFIHARAVPSTNAKTDAPAANLSDVQNNRHVSALPYAVVKLSSVHDAATAAVSGVRKLCQSKKPSGMSAM